MQLFFNWVNTLNGRLIFFWLVGGLVPVLLLGGTTAYISSYYIREQATHFANTLAQEKAQSLMNLQKPVVSISNHIASDSNMIDALFNTNSDSSISDIRIKALIENNLAHYFSLEGLSAISLILNEGRSYSLSIEVEVSNIDPILFQSQVENCQQLEGDELCWPGIQANINKKSRHTLVVPAIKKIYRLNEETMQEEHVGYLYMAFSTHSYRKMLIQESGHQMPLLVLDQADRFVSHIDASMAGKKVPPHLQPVSDGVPYHAKIDGESFFLVSHRSVISGWRFIVMVPEKQILQGMYHTLSIALAVVLLSFIFVLFAWVNMKRRVLKPLEALSMAMRDTERSIVEYSESENELREIRTLCYWYNNYVAIVEHRDQQAEQLGAAYDKLKQTQEQLIESEKMAALGKLVAGVAHEINTPLGVCLTSLTYSKGQHEKLEQQFVDNHIKRSDLERFLQKSQQGLDISINNLNRASELVRTFKTVATEQHVEELKTFSLAAYLKSTVISLEPKLKQKNVRIEWVCPQEIELCSYPGILWQVFSNLVMNSLIHGYEGADGGTIRIAAQLSENVIKIVYNDDGNGMSKEVVESIFLPFYTTKRNSGGTGLGMHIVYNIIAQKLKGSISCHSEMGLGTEFIISLPRETEP